MTVFSSIPLELQSAYQTLQLRAENRIPPVSEVWTEVSSLWIVLLLTWRYQVHG